MEGSVPGPVEILTSQTPPTLLSKIYADTIREIIRCSTRPSQKRKRTTKKGNTSITFLLSNIRKLVVADRVNAVSNIDHLRHLAEEQKPSFLGVVESHIDDSISNSDISITGYQTPIRRDRNIFGGGIVVWPRMGLDVSRLTEHEPAEQEVMWLTTTTQRGKLLMGIVYRPGSLPGSDDSMIQYLDANLDLIQQQHKISTSVILGDFNVHHQTWLSSKSPTDKVGRTTEQFANVHGIQAMETRSHQCHKAC